MGYRAPPKSLYFGLQTTRLIIPISLLKNNRMHSQLNHNTFAPPLLKNGVPVPVLLISLDDQQSRRRDLVKLGLPSEWASNYFPAHDMRSSCIEDVYESADVARLETKIGRPLRPAEVGCSMSHRSAARWLAASEQPMALVLEDDVVPNTPDWLTLTSAVATALLQHAHEGAAFICHLGARRGQTAVALKRRVILRENQPTTPIPDLFLHTDPKRGLWRAHAYLISAATATRIGREETRIMTLADDWCERRSLGLIDEILYTSPPLIRQDEERPSTIRPVSHDDQYKSPHYKGPVDDQLVRSIVDRSLFQRLRLSLRLQTATTMAQVQSRFPYRI